MVLMAMMTVFLLVSTALIITASSARVSGYYIRFAGLYDLAVAGNEQAKLLLWQALEQNSHDILYNIRQQLDMEDIEGHLTYRDGEYWLGGPFMRLFRDEKAGVISEFLEDSLARGFMRDHIWRNVPVHYFSYSLTLDTGTYEVRTALEPLGGGGFRVRSRANKNQGTDTLVYGIIEWLDFEALVILLTDDDFEILDFELKIDPLALKPRLSGVQLIANF